MDKKVNQMVERIDKKKVRNNTQKALLQLLQPGTKDGWVARTSLRVPSATARVRDLRKPEFGGFRVECIRANDLKARNPRRCVTSKVTEQQTFYRLDPASVTPEALSRALKGVIVTK